MPWLGWSSFVSARKRAEGISLEFLLCINITQLQNQWNFHHSSHTLVALLPCFHPIDLHLHLDSQPLEGSNRRLKAIKGSWRVVRLKFSVAWFEPVEHQKLSKAYWSFLQKNPLEARRGEFPFLVNYLIFPTFIIFFSTAVQKASICLGTTLWTAVDDKNCIWIYW